MLAESDMSRSIWLLLPYASAVAGYAGWRGPDVWNGWVIWVLALAPLALVAYVVVYEVRLLRNAKLALMMSVMPVLSCAWIALCGLGLAWMAVDRTKPITNAAVRAGVAAGVTAIVVGFGIFAARRRHKEPEANKSEPDPTEQPH
jgi:hypothetical protein